jgi:hypothetical protein
MILVYSISWTLHSIEHKRGNSGVARPSFYRGGEANTEGVRPTRGWHAPPGTLWNIESMKCDCVDNDNDVALSSQWSMGWNVREFVAIVQTLLSLVGMWLPEKIKRNSTFRAKALRWMFARNIEFLLIFSGSYIPTNDSKVYIDNETTYTCTCRQFKLLLYTTS